MIEMKSSAENENSSSLFTGSRWHDGLTWSNRVPMGLLVFHFPLEVMKKFLASISKTPANTNSEILVDLSLGTNMFPLMSLL